MAAGEYSEYSDSEILAQCHDLLLGLTAAVDRLQGKVDQLEAEFGPLARKYGKVVGAAAALPGVGFGRGGRNGRSGITGAGAVPFSRP